MLFGWWWLCGVSQHPSSFPSSADIEPLPQQNRFSRHDRFSSWSRIPLLSPLSPAGWQQFHRRLGPRRSSSFPLSPFLPHLFESLFGQSRAGRRRVLCTLRDSWLSPFFGSFALWLESNQWCGLSRSRHRLRASREAQILVRAAQPLDPQSAFSTAKQLLEERTQGQALALSVLRLFASLLVSVCLESCLSLHDWSFCWAFLNAHFSNYTRIHSLSSSSHSSSPVSLSQRWSLQQKFRMFAVSGKEVLVCSPSRNEFSTWWSCVLFPSARLKEATPRFSSSQIIPTEATAKEEKQTVVRHMPTHSRVAPCVLLSWSVLLFFSLVTSFLLRICADSFPLILLLNHCLDPFSNATERLLEEKRDKSREPEGKRRQGAMRNRLSLGVSVCVIKRRQREVDEQRHPDSQSSKNDKMTNKTKQREMEVNCNRSNKKMTIRLDNVKATQPEGALDRNNGLLKQGYAKMTKESQRNE